MTPDSRRVRKAPKRDARHLTGMTGVYQEVVKPTPKAVVRIPPTGAEGLVEIMMTVEK